MVRPPERRVIGELAKFFVDASETFPMRAAFKSAHDVDRHAKNEGDRRKGKYEVEGHGGLAGGRSRSSST